jgi:hypothetical protein
MALEVAFEVILEARVGSPPKSQVGNHKKETYMALGKQAVKQAAQAAPQGVPLNQWSQGGGLLDDADVTIIDTSWAEWDYNGNIDHKILALAVQFEDGEGKTYDQYYSGGELTYFVPSEDGSIAVPVGDKQLLNDNCNAIKFCQSLIEAGMPDEIMASGNVKEWVGLKCHVNQHAQPKRTGLIRGGKNADREPTVLLVTQIHELPGQTPAPAKKTIGKAVPARPTPVGKPAASRSAAARPVAGRAVPSSSAPARTAATSSKPANGVAAGTDDLEKAVATEILTGVLAVADNGQVEKRSLHTLVFRAAGEKVQAGELDAKQKTKIVQLCFQDSFLNGLVEEGVIQYDGAVVALAA